MSKANYFSADLVKANGLTISASSKLLEVPNWKLGRFIRQYRPELGSKLIGRDLLGLRLLLVLLDGRGIDVAPGLFDELFELINLKSQLDLSRLALSFDNRSKTVLIKTKEEALKFNTARYTVVYFDDLMKVHFSSYLDFPNRHQ